MTPLSFFLRTLRRTSAILLGVTIVLVHPSLRWQGQAVRAQKSPAAAAVDGLTAALRDDDARVRSAAAAALDEILRGVLGRHPAFSPGAARAVQPRGLEDLTRDLGASDPATRTRAACGLRDLGAAAAPAIASLVALLADGAPVDPTVCKLNWRNSELTSPGEQAASALVAIGSRAFEPVLGALKSAAWMARRNAAWALGALDDRRATPALLPALKDEDARVRRQAAWAIGAIR